MLNLNVAVETSSALEITRRAITSLQVFDRKFSSDMGLEGKTDALGLLINSALAEDHVKDSQRTIHKLTSSDIFTQARADELYEVKELLSTLHKAAQKNTFGQFNRPSSVSDLESTHYKYPQRGDSRVSVLTPVERQSKLASTERKNSLQSFTVLQEGVTTFQIFSEFIDKSLQSIKQQARASKDDEYDSNGEAYERMADQQERYQRSIARLQTMMDDIEAAQHRTTSVIDNLNALRQLCMAQLNV